MMVSFQIAKINEEPDTWYTMPFHINYEFIPHNRVQEKNKLRKN